MTQLTIGRDPASGLVVSDAFPRVSNNHATIELREGQLFFRDHSSNGTIINGNNVHREEVPLTNGDHIMLAGEYLLAWPVLLNFFPNLQRRTMRFDAQSINPMPEQVAQRLDPQPTAQQRDGYAPGAPQEQDDRRTRVYNGRGGAAPGTAPFGDRRTGIEQAGRTGVEMAGRTGVEMGGRTGMEVPGGAPFVAGQAPQGIPSPAAGQLNSVTQSEIDDTLRKFSVGAFLGSWAWAMANRIWWPLAIIPLSLIPYIGQMLSIYLCTYLGLNGNRLGWQHTKGVAFPQWRAAQKRWIWIGAFVFILCAAVQIFAFLYLTNL